MARDKRKAPFRDRPGQVLFIDARKMGRIADRSHRGLTEQDIAKIAGPYQAWLGDPDAGEHRDIPGFCKSAELIKLSKNSFIPPWVRGRRRRGGNEGSFHQNMARLVARLREQFAEEDRLDAVIAAALTLGKNHECASDKGAVARS